LAQVPVQASLVPARAQEQVSLVQALEQASLVQVQERPQVRVQVLPSSGPSQEPKRA
jgi:hypothetical protein